ncbi:MAG: restriction endonuclease [Bacteroidetes bacterium]|nr:restriction endonuclease [Bacteroidota bacterium]
MDWRKYEKEIYAIFKREFPKAEITSDTKLKGRYSLINRQIDILIQDYVAGNRITIVIDAKFFNQKIDVKDVECFIGMLADIGVHKGLLITQEGYTNAAIKRAYNDPSDVELDILNFKELKEYHGFLAFPFAGDISVFLPAPFGCVIDNRTKENDWLALIYQRGLTFEEAADKREWMYVNFWDRRIKNVSLDDLLKIQLATFDGLEAQIEMVPTIKRERNKTALRKVTIPTYPAPEYTGFVEFEDFIFYAVMFSPIELESKNIRKLENIMINVIPGKVKHEKPESEQVIE